MKVGDGHLEVLAHEGALGQLPDEAPQASAQLHTA